MKQRSPKQTLRPGTTGLVFVEGVDEVQVLAAWGVFVTPDGVQDGALETLIRAAAPPISDWSTCADDWERCVGPSSRAAARDKAWLRVASSAWPKIRKGWPQMLGEKDGIQVDNAAFGPLIRFLQQLLG